LISLGMPTRIWTLRVESDAGSMGERPALRQPWGLNRLPLEEPAVQPDDHGRRVGTIRLRGRAARLHVGRMNPSFATVYTP
jgi:hypothetical protein